MIMEPPVHTGNLGGVDDELRAGSGTHLLPSSVAESLADVVQPLHLVRVDIDVIGSRSDPVL